MFPTSLYFALLKLGSPNRAEKPLRTCGRKKFLNKLPRPLLSTYLFVHRGLKLVQLVKTARKHERFIEGLGDDIRVAPGFGFYLRPSYCFLAHMQSPVSGLASLLGEHENTPRSPEAV